MATGPAYVPGAPRIDNPGVLPMAPDEPGETLLVSGTVRSTSGKPLPGAVIDLWQTTADGRHSGLTPEQAGPWRAPWFREGRCTAWSSALWSQGQAALNRSRARRKRGDRVFVNPVHQVPATCAPVPPQGTEGKAEERHARKFRPSPTGPPCRPPLRPSPGTRHPRLARRLERHPRAPSSGRRPPARPSTRSPGTADESPNQVTSATDRDAPRRPSGLPVGTLEPAVRRERAPACSSPPRPRLPPCARPLPRRPPR
ncbi:hypothetical protein [Streptomyces ossamyceticus]|uniref:dioxygenase family protein n=1 Tax=Streptomyces ossamyceticus TaxID=249581 RepID=UPI003430D1F6